VWFTLDEPSLIAFKEIYDPQDLIEYMLMKHHTNSMSQLLVVATGLRALRQGPKETIEQYLLCAKKLRDELEPYPEWRVAIGQLKSDIFAGLRPEFAKYITAINDTILQYDLLHYELDLVGPVSTGRRRHGHAHHSSHL
jgi:hypothetical protein